MPKRLDTRVEIRTGSTSTNATAKVDSTTEIKRTGYLRMSAYKMAELNQQDFNRSALTVQRKRAWYTGQQTERIPSGLVRVIGVDCVSLDLSYNALSSVSALKDCTDLEELILDNNCLEDLKTLPVMPSLTTLSVNNNKLADIDGVLKRIKDCCPKVEYVSLLGNPGYPDQLTNPTLNDDEDYERFRLYSIYVLPPSIRFLDYRAVTASERSNARNRGRFYRTVKLTQESPGLPPSSSIDEYDGLDFINYTPLPRSVRTPQDHKGAYGKCKYRYSGKNSEGNRFISNNDL
ncbi:leucine-rich melanocyte differentiation-associated protein isoform X2 [Cephus cinctus]|uniref:Leucine-rich melanocyte differentiation-associated protein isoform X2 n=1 Tax=Cephus cinctus TaxID=211228 RepID=A0AAJ7FNR3_CEPCN|nr:leucine-rich melanocyte differentiation-associated protein isoform X2 [Cephus cinctus]